jgi:hypothetical protein
MICIPEKIAFTMLPCRKQSDTAVVKRMKVVNDQEEKHARKRLLESMSSEQEVPWKRLLAEAGGGTEHCSSKHVNTTPYSFIMHMSYLSRSHDSLIDFFHAIGVA